MRRAANDAARPERTDPMTTRIEVLVLITVGDEAHVQIPGRADYLRMPGQPIAQDAGLPIGELAGRRFEAAWDGEVLTGFRLLDDPRV